jgi:hypothetical protein
LTLRLQITDGSLTWQSNDGVVGAVHVYGPLTGTLEITPAADASALPLVKPTNACGVSHVEG